MRRRLAAVAIVGALSSALAGDAPAKSVLHAPDPWKAKQTTTETGRWRESVARATARPSETTVEYALVRRCTKTDDRGRFLEGDFWFRRWSRNAGGLIDRSLEGAHLAVARGRQWGVAFALVEPLADSGVKWMDEFLRGPDPFGDEVDAAEGDDEPAAELVVGAPVESRAAATERRLAAAGVPFPATGIVAKFTLTAVRPSPAGAQIAYGRAVEFASQGKGKADGKDVEYLPGTTTRETTSIVKTLGAGRSTTSRTFDVLRTVVIAGASERTRTETHVVGTSARTAGGEIPAIKRAGDVEDK